MDNYEKMRRSAVERFLTYDTQALLNNPGVQPWEKGLQTTFLSRQVYLDREAGEVYIENDNDVQVCDFSQTLSILDYVCDRKCSVNAAASYCPIGSLPGVLVTGIGLSMNPTPLAMDIERNPRAFRAACACMGGVEIGAGDMGYRLPIFPDLCVEVKFYYSDEDFPASLTFLWDKHILQFVRYETVYYIAGALCRLLESAMQKKASF